jgi:hypothetical protein
MSDDRLEILSPKLVKRRWGGGWMHEHWCPGCETTHAIAVEQPFGNGARWSFDGNVASPTFSPSINVGPNSSLQCHYFITAGKILFCGDCHHTLKGQTVDLPDIPKDEI